MRGVIFGGGVVALIAKKLFPDWTIVPFGRSRFYSYTPPLADNFISRSDDIDAAVADLGIDVKASFSYRRCYSVGGELITAHNANLCQAWLSKLFGADGIPGQATPYLSTRMVHQIYPARVNVLFEKLQNEMLPVLKAEASLGKVTQIGSHYFVRDGVRTDFDNAISTIPLSVLLGLLGRGSDLRYKNEHIAMVRSNKIDLEGHNQAFVTDAVFDFYRVSNIAKDTYLFYFLNDTVSAGAYLLPIIGNADVVDGTMVVDSIPVGDMPDLSWLDDYGIFCVGSYAQHDWCADVGSNILRLVRYLGRGGKPK